MASKLASVLRMPSCSARTSSWLRLARAYTSNTTTALPPRLSAVYLSSRSCPATNLPASSSARERTLLRATAIAYEIKRELRTVGITLRCSIGLAPNRLLAKIAGDMQKPDGLMIFERRYLPQSLYSLELADIPGIGKRMEQRILGRRPLLAGWLL
jgi:nucleotidyltransferase/DNA polymerase involved in DNA repair